ncbi:MAG: hypothetical protein M3Q45_09405 [Chloroflexota bacterium]|nr:hypothetical protein [Chloroflexota bacterium]
MGIIDSLSAGYRYLGWRFYLVLIPVGLDLLLWRTPRLSVAPLFEQLADLYTGMAAVEGVPPDVTELARQMSPVIAGAGEETNLLAMLVNNVLLHVPSILAVISPLPGVAPRQLADPWLALGLAGLFALLGLWIGAIYLNLLAQQLPIGTGVKQPAVAALVGTSVRHWLKLLLFVGVVCFGLLAIYIPMSISAGLILFFSPFFSSLLVLLLSGLIFVLLFYLYFVPAGLILDNLGLRSAIGQSFRLVRTHFWSTLGFFLLTNLISAGFGLLFNQLAVYQPLGTLTAIVANAYIGTGLALALLIFYRTHLLQNAIEL